ncbi:MAG: ABC transporter substrate-binding protein, partial [Lachnospiraceae bacterium]|nr:ABC transporter substrate-binding protein [Lachnospiraceae bacterium]
MKKRIAAIFLVLLMIVGLCSCSGTSGLTKVNLNEVAHSIFYAPMYVAIEEGYFKDEGLDVNLVNGLGADKTMTAVLSGDADIGFMGSEASIYVYNEGAEDYVVN